MQKHTSHKQHAAHSTAKSKSGFAARLASSVLPAKEYLISYLHDSIFYAIAVPFFFLFSYIINSSAQNVDTSLLTENIFYQPPEVIQGLNQSLQDLVIIVVVSIVVLALILVAAYSLSRGLAYSRLLGKKMSSRYFLKFSLMNLFFLIASILLLALPFVVFISTINHLLTLGSVFAYSVLLAMIIIILVASYFISLSYIAYTKKPVGVFLSIGEAFVVGFTKFRLIWKELLTIFITFVIMGYIVNFIPNKIISLFIFIAYTAWLRRYFVQSASELVRS